MRKLWALSAVVAVAAAGLVIKQPSVAASNVVTRAAFYYPWFPETEAWATQYSPALAKYDSSNSTILATHVAQAKFAGLDAFIASYWGRASRTGKRLPLLLDAARAQRFAIAPYYEPESYSTALSPAELKADFDSLYAATLNEPAWLRADGKPVLFIYNTGSQATCSEVERLRTASAGRFYLNMKVFTGYRECSQQPDSWHQYGPAVSYSQHGSHSSNVSPGFFKFDEATPRLVRDLTRFKSDLARQVVSGTRWQLVTSFNEWGEGTSVEPAAQWQSGSGMGLYLDAMREAYGSAAPAPSASASQTATASPTPSYSTTSPSGPSTAPETELTVWAAGDACDDDNGVPGCREVGNVIKSDGSTDAFLALGDLQYEQGESANFSTYYNAGLGREQKFNDGRSIFDVTIPAVGNHEYLTPGAAGYFGYFRDKAGDPAKGYFSRDLGKWRVVSVNTNCSQAGGCASTSPQGSWLISELDDARRAGDSVVVITHHPPFSDGSNYAPGVASAQMIFTMALDGGADVFLSGHDHQYQRFGPVIQDGSRHPAGLAYWVVGTGGKGNTGFNPSYARTLARWGLSGSLPGALRLTLRSDGSFGFQFKTTDGVIRDSGSGTSRA